MLRFAETMETNFLRWGTTTELDSLKLKIRQLRSFSLALEKLDKASARSNTGMTLLVSIVETCHDIATQNAFIDIQDRETAQDRLQVSKLRNYPAICKTLVRYAESVPIFEKIGISVVKIPASECQNTGPDQFVASTIQKLNNTAQGRKIATKAIRSGFPDGASYISNSAALKHPVHAEIQLLLHYDRSKGIPPRFICASKHACFLCGLFFKLHGQFVPPNTHGRLYEKWTLPEHSSGGRTGLSSAMATVVQRFETEIAERINSEIGRKRKPSAPPPESDIFPSVTATINTLHSSQHPELEASEPLQAASSICTSDSESLLSSAGSSTSEASFYLERGVQFAHHLGQSGPFVTFHSPSVNIILDSEALAESAEGPMSLGANSQQPVQILLKWQLRESEALNEDSGLPVQAIDVEDLPESTDVTMEIPETSRSQAICLRRDQEEVILEWR